MSDATPLSWFIIQARPGQEKSVAASLRDRIARSDQANLFGEALVPSEEVMDMHKGQKRLTERKFFPGYILVQIATPDGEIDPGCWHLVKQTDKVSGFIGGTPSRPRPITEVEANRILDRVAKSAKAPRPSVLFSPGQLVRVVEGPFNDFEGVVDEFDANKATVRVSVAIFGRATPVDFSLGQVKAA